MLRLAKEASVEALKDGLQKKTGVKAKNVNIYFCFSVRPSIKDAVFCPMPVCLTCRQSQSNLLILQHYIVILILEIDVRLSSFASKMPTV